MARRKLDLMRRFGDFSIETSEVILPRARQKFDKQLNGKQWKWEEQVSLSPRNLRNFESKLFGIIFNVVSKIWELGVH